MRSLRRLPKIITERRKRKQIVLHQWARLTDALASWRFGARVAWGARGMASWRAARRSVQGWAARPATCERENGGRRERVGEREVREREKTEGGGGWGKIPRGARGV
jgi:hypothetical protein